MHELDGADSPLLSLLDAVYASFQEVCAFGGEYGAGPAFSFGVQDIRGAQYPQEFTGGEPRVKHGETGVGVAIRFSRVERPPRPDPARLPIPADDGPVRADAEEAGAEPALAHFQDALVQAGIVPVKTARVGMDVHRGVLVEQVRAHAARLPINRP